MKTALTLVLLTLLAFSTGAAPGLAASQDQAELPSALVGRWSRTVSLSAR